MASATTDTRPSSSLPGPIRRGLGKVDRKLKRVALARGLGTAALVLAAGAALGMAADFAWALPLAVRWAIWALWVATGGALVAWGVVRPMVRRPGWADLAAVAERGHPELGERLTGAVGLLEERANGSPTLIAALAEDAAKGAEATDLAGAISGRGAGRRLALGAAALGLVVLPAVVKPDPFGALWARFLVPWADRDRVGRFVLEVRPGDRVVAIGSDVAVGATVRPRFGGGSLPEEAWLEWTDAQGGDHRARMAAEEGETAAARAFAITMPRLAGSVKYRVASGSAQSRRHTIRAVEPPAVAAMSAEVEPPAYTKLPKAKAKDPARIEAWEGSRIALTLSASKPVRGVEVTWPREGEATPAEATSKAKPPTRTVGLRPTGDKQEWMATLHAEASGTYAFAMVDEYDIANRPDGPRRVVVRADGPPLVAVAGSDRPREMGPEEVLRLGVAARDDVAVASVELHYTIERAGTTGEPEAGHVAAPLEGLGTRSARGGGRCWSWRR